MGIHASDAPAWLFSFVDLAFLLLIAMTQIGGTGASPDLGEISVPRVPAGAVSDLPTGAPDRWQLRIHPPDAPGPPFQLMRPDAPASEPSVPRLTGDALRGKRGERT